jgi:hypothetical protein
MATAGQQTKGAWEAKLTLATRCFPVPIAPRITEPADPTVDADAPAQIPGAASVGRIPVLAGESPASAADVRIVRAWDEYVEVYRPGTDDGIRFRVNHRAGRSLTFTDAREEGTGTIGTTGIWGTLPPQPAGRRRVLTPTAFTAELARFVGFERACEIVQSIQAENFFE